MDRVFEIVGGGFSGLALAYALVLRGRKVRLFEGSDRLGGLIDTLDTPFGPVERAANGLLDSKLVNQLFHDVNVMPVRPKAEGRRRYIYHHRPTRWPINVGETLGLSVRLLTRLTRRQEWAPQPGESVLTWSRRTVGETACRQLLNPALSGIYASSSDQLSARLIANSVFSSGGRSFRRRGLVSAKGGMNELIKGMSKFLRAKGVEIRLSEKWQGRPHRRLALCCGPKAAASIVAPHDPELARWLNDIDVLPLVAVQTFFNRSEWDLKGFGCLFAHGSGVRSLGVLLNHHIFSPSEIHSERWILGGAGDRKVHHLSDGEILAAVANDRLLASRIQEQPDFSVITRWPEAIPHYNLRLEEILGQSKEFIDGPCKIFGNFTGALGLGRILEKAMEFSTRWDEEES